MPLFQASGGRQQQDNNHQNGDQLPQKGRVKSVLRYTMMPEILPRIRALGFHFGHFAYLLAIIFGSARLIDRNHPVMNAANMGQYGIREVIAIAANNLTWSRNNIDQIAIFSAIVIGLIMIIIQAGLIALAALSGFGNEANAQGFFSSPAGYVAADDPMMIFFAQVFGNLNGFWGADFTSGSYVFGTHTSIHEGIYAILSYYSMAMMVIAMIIVIYYFMIVVAEAAQSGTPFGKRFNSVWAPIRLCIALGLLVPLGSGLNSAQYLTLWLAKAGANLGTSAWVLMADSMSRPDAAKNIIGEFQNDWITEAAFNIFYLETCMYASNQENYNNAEHPEGIKRRLISEGGEDNSFKFKVAYDRGQRTFGDGTYRSCGEITISISGTGETSDVLGRGSGLSVESSYDLAVAIIKDLMGPLDSNETGGKAIPSSALGMAREQISVGGRVPFSGFYYNNVNTAANIVEGNNIDSSLVTDHKQEMQDHIQELYDNRLRSFVFAGVWYLELSRIIQESKMIMVNTVPNFNIGEISLRVQSDVQRSGGVIHSPFSRNIGSETESYLENLFADMKRNASVYYNLDEKENIPQQCQDIGDEASWWDGAACLIAAIIIPKELTILAYGDNTLNPMSSLISAGYEIFQKSWWSIGTGIAASVGSGIFSAGGRRLASSAVPGAAIFGNIAGIISGILGVLGPIAVLIGTLGISVGFVLFFLVPVLPFIYFFFAVLAWVMEIFEAIIGMPLWALAHLQIDGDGMPGDKAIGGYYLLLSILIRPAIIVVALVGASLIFGGAVYMLQTLFKSVIVIKGAGNSSGLENLIYTIIFAYVVYTIGITTFKLVDTIPNHIMTWMGSSVSEFSDQHDVDLGGQTNMIAAAGGFIAGSISSDLNKTATNFGGNIGNINFPGGEPPKGSGPGSGPRGGGPRSGPGGGVGPERQLGGPGSGGRNTTGDSKASTGASRSQSNPHNPSTESADYSMWEKAYNTTDPNKKGEADAARRRYEKRHGKQE